MLVLMCSGVKDCLGFCFFYTSRGLQEKKMDGTTALDVTIVTPEWPGPFAFSKLRPLTSLRNQIGTASSLSQL